MMTNGRGALNEEVRRPRQLGLVRLSADVGGAEVLCVELAAALRRAGVGAEVVFVLGDGPLCDRLTAAGVPYRTLGFKRGRDVVLYPRRFARETSRSAAEGALLPECGFIGAALRGGGYRAPIVAVEHGALHNPASRRTKRMLHAVARRWGAWADDAEVAVSDFTLMRMRERPHAKHVCRIHNGVDPARFASAAVARSPAPGVRCEIGFAGRLIAGKGADVLIRALAQVKRRLPAKLRLAGDGPERSRLSSLAHELGIGEDVEFMGMLSDIRAFWQSIDVAAFPSDRWVDSFGMSALEAMACGKPVVATRCGGVPEVVLDGVTGTVVPPGDVDALAHALVVYGESVELRRRHGDAGRARTLQSFNIDECAALYVALFADLAAQRQARR